MDTKITFEFPFTDADGKGCNSQVRVVTIDGNPWFVARDVCSVLYDAEQVRLNGVTNNLKNIATDEKRRMWREELIARALLAGNERGSTSLALISESGLYKLIMRSDKPQARAFQDWVTREVLPRIRKDGAYVMGEEKHGSVEDTVKAMYRAMQEKGRLLQWRPCLAV